MKTRNGNLTAMAEKPIKLTLPTGQILDGVEVDVKQTTEKWSDVELEDGSVLRVKTTVLSVVRQNNQWDAEGYPVYMLKTVPAMTIISSPDKLKRGVQ